MCRCNFQVRIWKLAHVAEPSVPNPNDGHGWTFETGIMQPKWTDGVVMPWQLVDILKETIENDIGESYCESDSELDESDLIEGMGSDSDRESDSDA